VQVKVSTWAIDHLSAGFHLSILYKIKDKFLTLVGESPQDCLPVENDILIVFALSEF